MTPAHWRRHARTWRQSAINCERHGIVQDLVGVGIERDGLAWQRTRAGPKSWYVRPDAAGISRPTPKSLPSPRLGLLPCNATRCDEL